MASIENIDEIQSSDINKETNLASKEEKQKYEYVTTETFNLFYDDYIDYKKYMDDILKTFLKDSNESVKTSAESPEFAENKILKGKIRNSEETIKVLTGENEKLKKECENLIRIIETLSTNKKSNDINKKVSQENNISANVTQRKKKKANKINETEQISNI